MKDQERTPLRTILLNFLNHIENLEARRSAEDSYDSEFQELKLFSETLKTSKQYSCSEGEKEVNRKKNRYKDILPFDLSRVILNEYAGIPGSDYINANYIKGASGSPAYIASQGPLPNTVNDFWRMVVQCEVQVIVMACNEEEAGKHKCENYWVEGEGEEKQFGMVTIRLIKASTVCPDFSVRTMRLKYANTQSNMEERTVCQFHYSAWPDHGVPPLVRPLLDMVRLVRDTQASETLPVLVHCSAGCGRTGTICAIDYVWGLLRAGKLTKDFSLLSLVREMRKQRIAMVQTKEQYVLVHRAVRELFKEQLRMIDSHPYENIDCNGLPIDTEPAYDTICDTKYVEEVEKTMKEDKEKQVSVIAPPLPQKKRFPVPSSKHEKEVENLSEKQRIAEQAGSSSENMSGCGGGHCVRIAKLKSLFERDSKQVSRSHSLGALKKPQIIKKEPIRPIPSHGIVRVAQLPQEKCPALPVKRSKSLRVLGSSDRYRLSIPADPPPMLDDKTRRLSLESNMDLCEREDFQEGRYFLRTGVDSVVAGLAVRERRNSFREAVNKTDQNYENVPHKPAIGTFVRSYTAIDIRPSNRHEIFAQDVKSKPVMLSKPPFLCAHEGSRARTLMNSENLWKTETANVIALQKKKIITKLENVDSLKATDIAKNPSLLSSFVNSKLSPNATTIVKGLPKKEKNALQPTSHVSESAKPKFPLSSAHEEVFETNLNKQQGAIANSLDKPLVWKQQFKPVFSDRRIPSRNVKTGRAITQSKGDPVHRGQGQVNLVNDFSKEIHSTPSHSEGSVNSTPSPLHSLHPSQSQTTGRYHGARHVVFDSRFNGQESKNYVGLRQAPAIDSVVNDKRRALVLQKQRQLYSEISSPLSVHQDYRQDSSMNFSGNVSVLEGPHGFKNVSSPQVVRRQSSSSGVVDQRHIQHHSDSKTVCGPQSACGNINDSPFYPNCTNDSNCRTMTEPEITSPNDGAMRSLNYHGSLPVSSVDHYRSPSLCTVLARQAAAAAGTNLSRPLVNPTNESEHPPGYGGVKLRRGSQDDLALCAQGGGPVTPSRVKRHASVVVLRHSFIDTSEGSPQLTIWNCPPANGDVFRGSAPHNLQFNKESEDPWSGAIGVDLDQVAASMTSQKDGSSSKLMKAALQALHQRKGFPASAEQSKTPEQKYSSTVQTPSSSGLKTMTPTNTTPQHPPFRKQQQYL